MANKSESDRKAIIQSKSPLAKHSLSSKNMRDQRAGVIRIFGKEVINADSTKRREMLKQTRRQELYDSIVNIFEGQVSEEDLVRIGFLMEEFEEQDKDIINATIVDFRGLKPTAEYFGEPGFFKKNGKNGHK